VRNGRMCFSLGKNEKGNKKKIKKIRAIEDLEKGN
jgi:hypothetical protein